MIPTRLFKLVTLGGCILAATPWVGSSSFSQSSSVRKSAASSDTMIVSDEYVGSEACKDCHEAQFKNFSRTAHAKLATARDWKGKVSGCETCHGPGKAHSQRPF